MYFETVAWEMRKPSLSSSPCILGAPHKGFSRDMRRISAFISAEISGRPRLRGLDFQVQ